MLKKDELTDLSSCMSRARSNEMTFVLLARDPAAPEAIRAWIQARLRLGKNQPNDPQLVEALECAMYMEQHGKPIDDSDPIPRCAFCSAIENLDGSVNHFRFCPALR